MRIYMYDMYKKKSFSTQLVTREKKYHKTHNHYLNLLLSSQTGKRRGSHYSASHVVKCKTNYNGGGVLPIICIIWVYIPLYVLYTLGYIYVCNRLCHALSPKKHLLWKKKWYLIAWPEEIICDSFACIILSDIMLTNPQLCQ